MLTRPWGIRRFVTFYAAKEKVMRQKVFVWLLFLVLVPGVLSAQERKLKGKVVRVGAQGEELL